VDGQDVPDSQRVVTMAQQIDRELPQLLKEHRAILDAAKRLKDAAGRESKPEYAYLADQLWTHAIMEDQVLYPASMLVARYLTLKQSGSARTAPRQGGR
jgi:hypothetical protein